MTKSHPGSFRHTFFIILTLFGSILVYGCSPLPFSKFLPAQPTIISPTPTLPGANPLVFSVIPIPIGYGYSGGWVEVFFTDPFSGLAHFQEDGIEGRLIDSIGKAKVSLDVAIYSMNDYPLERAIIEANQRGVSVRMVMESDSMDTTTVDRLRGAGIPIRGDESLGLMHHKFIVVDGVEVWTGSANFTYDSFYQDHNNLLHIMDQVVAEEYSIEFTEMFEQGLFGPNFRVDGPTLRVEKADLVVETYFSPDDQAARQIVHLLNNARKSVYFMAYTFTVADYSEILIGKKQDGLDVQGILDELMLGSESSEYSVLVDAGIPVFVDSGDGLMHHKVIIIDEEIVITGSYNFTANAERQNDENMLILWNKDLARFYLEEFSRLKK